MATIRIRTQWLGLQGGSGLSTLFAIPPGTSGAQVQAAVDVVRDFWTALNSAIYSAISWTVSGVVDTIDPSTGQITGQTLVTARTGAGTAAGDPLPQQCQGLLRLNSGAFLNGRQVTGHLFIPGPMEGSSTAPGVPSSGYLTTLQNAANTMASAAALGLAVYSRRNLQSISPVSAVALGKWAVLRSRRD